MNKVENWRTHVDSLTVALVACLVYGVLGIYREAVCYAHTRTHARTHAHTHTMD